MDELKQNYWCMQLLLSLSIWYTSRACHRLSIIWKYIYVTFQCDIVVHIRKWTILSIHKPKVIKFKFKLHNLVDLILLIPVSCCLVQFWRRYRLHGESQHWTGNIHIGWGFPKTSQGTTIHAGLLFPWIQVWLDFFPIVPSLCELVGCLMSCSSLA